MDVIESNQNFVPSQQAHESEALGSLLNCCKETIDLHAAYNSMMVCSECKQIIKCFDNEKAFNNYRRFCASRHRRILATEYKTTYVVVFSSYDTYST